MNTRDVILFLIFGGVGVLGAALLIVPAVTFDRVYHRFDPPPPPPPVQSLRRVRFALAVATLIDNATWLARGAR